MFREREGGRERNLVYRSVDLINLKGLEKYLNVEKIREVSFLIWILLSRNICFFGLKLNKCKCIVNCEVLGEF